MKRLFEIDLKDYKKTDSVFRRPSARAVIIRDDKIALVYSKRKKYYKFPGGGINGNEDKKEALIREVREEVGMIVVPERDPACGKRPAEEEEGKTGPDTGYDNG